MFPLPREPESPTQVFKLFPPRLDTSSPRGPLGTPGNTLPHASTPPSNGYVFVPCVFWLPDKYSIAQGSFFFVFSRSGQPSSVRICTPVGGYSSRSLSFSLWVPFRAWVLFFSFPELARFHHPLFRPNRLPAVTSTFVLQSVSLHLQDSFTPTVSACSSLFFSFCSRTSAFWALSAPLTYCLLFQAPRTSSHVATGVPSSAPFLPDGSRQPSSARVSSARPHHAPAPLGAFPGFILHDTDVALMNPFCGLPGFFSPPPLFCSTPGRPFSYSLCPRAFFSRLHVVFTFHCSLTPPHAN